MKSISKYITLVVFLAAILCQSCKSQELCPAYSQAEHEYQEIYPDQT